MTEILNVYFKNKLAGYLSYDNGLLSFQYHRDYLSDKDRTPISASLPLCDEIFGDNIARPFFDGLLPEDSARVQIARILQTDSRNTFALLKSIGADCAGAISVYPQNAKINVLSAPEYRYIEDDEAYNILSSLKVRPLYIGDDDFRISGAGAQDKLIACFINNKLVLPLNGTPSTHIIKPNIEGYADTVFNELFCMKLAKACGLNAPTCYIKTIKDKKFYVVQRYDRENYDGLWTRIHQEDFCQILNILPENKYESDGGPNLKSCFNLLSQIGVSAVSKIAFIDLIIFNYLIGNGDAHAKNFSVLYKNNIPELAPCYDLMCTAVMSEYYEKHKMAMKLSSSKYYMSKVRRENFEKLSEISGYRSDFILKRLDILSSKILKKAYELADELNSSQDTKSDVYLSIIEIIKKHICMTTKIL
ncbi:MAG: type II toxin-antitoxin system HipA family toxin [Alphaproteobacteria bacterium]|nr:type II toxin-antitoxin system HipA family toxin [Alphaproteobacteria bacterium]